MKKSRIAILALEGVFGVFLAILLFGALERAFGGIGFVFGTLVVLAMAAVFFLVASLRTRRLNP